MTRHDRWLLVVLAVGVTVSAAGCEVHVTGDVLFEHEARVAAEARAAAAEKRASDWQTYFVLACCAATVLFPLGIGLGIWLQSRFPATRLYQPSPRAGRRRLGARPPLLGAGWGQEPTVLVVCPGCRVAGTLPRCHAGHPVRCKRCEQSFLAGVVPLPGLPAARGETWRN